jgi:hypothetical protein
MKCVAMVSATALSLTLCAGRVSPRRTTRLKTHAAPTTASGSHRPRREPRALTPPRNPSGGLRYMPAIGALPGTVSPGREPGAAMTSTPSRTRTAAVP